MSAERLAIIGRHQDAPRGPVRRGWRDLADEMAQRFDEAFPCSPLCAFYVRRCHAEVSGVSRRQFARYMKSSLRALRGDV